VQKKTEYTFLAKSAEQERLQQLNLPTTVLKSIFRASRNILDEKDPKISILREKLLVQQFEHQM
jgi:hypothetical protein